MFTSDASATHKSFHRISLKFVSPVTKKETKLDDDSRSLESYGIVNSGTVITFKDLGPQIGYRTVFLLEYAGPIVFVLLYATRPSFVYSAIDGKQASELPFNWVALLAISCWVIHFLKREFETIFIHKFSRPTMPLFNLFKNCAYYWTFGSVIGISMFALYFDVYIKITSQHNTTHHRIPTCRSKADIP